MTTSNYIKENKTSSLKYGDKVLMYNCYEAGLDKYRNKEIICITDSFIDKSGEEVVFLSGVSGYFSVKYLKKVD